MTNPRSFPSFATLMLATLLTVQGRIQSQGTTGQRYFEEGPLMTLAGLTCYDPSFADVTGDGLADFLRPSFVTCCVLVYTGTSNLGFTGPQFIVAPSNFYVGRALSGDIDRDGTSDVIVLGEADFGSQPISAFYVRSLGGGIFGPRQVFPFGPASLFAGGPNMGLLADLDADGDLEALIQSQVGAYSNGTTLVDVYDPGAPGGPVLVSSLSYPHPQGLLAPFAVSHTGDFNGDGKADVVGVFGETLTPTTGTIRGIAAVPGSTSAPFLGTPVRRGLPTSYQNTMGFIHYALIAVGDINLDGLDDVVGIAGHGTASGGVSGGLFVAYGDAQQVLGPVQSLVFPYTDHNGRVPPLIADVTADGWPDIITVGAQPDPTFLNVWLSQWIEVRVNDGLGGFSAPLITPLTLPYLTGLDASLARNGAFDNDRDGDLDLFVSGLTAGATTILENTALQGPGCGGQGGLILPEITGDRPYLGNSTFSVRLSNALPSTLTLFGLSLGALPTAGPCGGPFLDLQTGMLILPADPFGFAITDGLGNSSLTIPVPNDPLLDGLRVYAQWGVLDTTVPRGFSLSRLRSFIVR